MLKIIAEELNVHAVRIDIAQTEKGKLEAEYIPETGTYDVLLNGERQKKPELAKKLFEASEL